MRSVARGIVRGMIEGNRDQMKDLGARRNPALRHAWGVPGSDSHTLQGGNDARIAESRSRFTDSIVKALTEPSDPRLPRTLSPA